jgi:hypothetical protein
VTWYQEPISGKYWTGASSTYLALLLQLATELNYNLGKTGKRDYEVNRLTREH